MHTQAYKKDYFIWFKYVSKERLEQETELLLLSENDRHYHPIALGRYANSFAGKITRHKIGSVAGAIQPHANELSGQFRIRKFMELCIFGKIFPEGTSHVIETTEVTGEITPIRAGVREVVIF